MPTQLEIDIISVDFNWKLKKLLGARKRWLRNMGKPGESDALEGLADAADDLKETARLLSATLTERDVDGS